MIWRSPEPRYDVASGVSQGRRDNQEDAIVTDFPFGLDSGVAVLADGMGGHEAGDLASNIVVTQVYSELKTRSAEIVADEGRIGACFGAGAAKANAGIREYVTENPGAIGMGATLLALVLVESRMFWVSVGDSPLYLLRDEKLTQLNEDHSLAPQIDFMVEQGLLTRQDALEHPDRNCLTSAIMGNKIAKSDCPAVPFELQMGDIILLSSDGLQYLGDDKLGQLLRRFRRRKSTDIAGHLLAAINELDDPDQDNVSFSVIKVNHVNAVAHPASSTPDRCETRVVPLKPPVRMPVDNQAAVTPAFQSCRTAKGASS